MDPALAELRRQKAQQYRSTPAEQRPKLQICGDCNKDVYSSAVCMKTGYLHGQKKEHLVAGLLVDASKRQFTGVELMQAIEAVRVRWQPTRVQIVKADSTSLNIFQSFVYSMNWKCQRYGILYGTYEESSKTVQVHCIYEPEQIGREHDFRLKDDPREERVNELAKLLGLRRVGCVCTHSPRDEEAVTLSGTELLLCAKEQSRFGDHCVLITMGPNVETGHINAQCWQASQQCVRYFQMGILSVGDENKLSSTSSSSVSTPVASTPATASPTAPPPLEMHQICSSIPLEIAQEDTEPSGHKRCVIKESSCVIDTRWMTGYIAVEAFSSTVVSNLFIRSSRPGSAPPNFGNLRIFFQDPRRVRLKFLEKIRDFHVLIFLMENLFDVTSEMPHLIGMMLSGNHAAAEVYEELVNDRIKGF